LPCDGKSCNSRIQTPLLIPRPCSKRPNLRRVSKPWTPKSLLTGGRTSNPPLSKAGFWRL